MSADGSPCVHVDFPGLGGISALRCVKTGARRDDKGSTFSCALAFVPSRTTPQRETLTAVNMYNMPIGQYAAAVPALIVLVDSGSAALWGPVLSDTVERPGFPSASCHPASQWKSPVM